MGHSSPHVQPHEALDYQASGATYATHSYPMTAEDMLSLRADLFELHRQLDLHVNLPQQTSLHTKGFIDNAGNRRLTTSTSLAKGALRACTIALMNQDTSQNLRFRYDNTTDDFYVANLHERTPLYRATKPHDVMQHLAYHIPGAHSVQRRRAQLSRVTARDIPDAIHDLALEYGHETEVTEVFSHHDTTYTHRNIPFTQRSIFLSRTINDGADAAQGQLTVCSQPLSIHNGLPLQGVIYGRQFNYSWPTAPDSSTSERILGSASVFAASSHPLYDLDYLTAMIKPEHSIIDRPSVLAMSSDYRRDMTDAAKTLAASQLSELDFLTE